MIELTEGQRKPLFELVKFQKTQKRDFVFAIRAGWDYEVRTWEKHTDEGEPIMRVPMEFFELWSKNNYIEYSQRGVGGGPFASQISTFILRQEVIDYESFMRKPAVIRSLIKLWKALVDDIPSLVWGIVGGVVSAIITVIAMKFLGLTP